jgi:hypothetical protein
VIAWWERRRLPFNLIVGATGVVTLLTVNLFAALPPFGFGPRIPAAAVAAYALLANLFYSSGWAFEIAFNTWWGNSPPRIGPLLFRQGLLFAIGLTLLPIGIAAVAFAARVLRLIL